MVLNVNPGYFSIEQAQAQLSSLSFEALIEEDESCLDELENRNIGGILSALECYQQKEDEL